MNSNSRMWLRGFKVLGFGLSLLPPGFVISRRRNFMRRIYTNLLPIAVFLVLVPTALASTTWYVDGVNGNDGRGAVG